MVTSFLHNQAHCQKHYLKYGQEVKVNYEDIQIGELIKIRKGMHVPVDGVIYKADSVTVDESMYTGDLEPYEKDTLENCMIKV